MIMAYAYKPAKVDLARTAKARLEDVNVSYKDLANVCSNVRGRRADAALEFLSEAADGMRPVRYFNYNKRRGHVGRLGGKKGGWPVKSAKIVRDVLENAMANARSRGLGMCKITHIQANKQHQYPRLAAKGRRMRADMETAFLEIVLTELSTEMGKKAEIAATKPEDAKKIEIKKPEIETKKAEDVKKENEAKKEADVKKTDGAKKTEVEVKKTEEAKKAEEVEKEADVKKSEEVKNVDAKA